VVHVVVGSWRGAHLAVCVVRPFGRFGSSLVFAASSIRSLARFPREPPDANPSAMLHFGASILRPGRFNGLLPGFVHTIRHECRTMCLAPLHRRTDPASTPAPTRGSSLRPRGFHPRSLVPSSWFCTTSTVSSAVPAAGLLHPAADLGFIALLPAMQDLPPEEFPADSRSASPRSLPPCRFFRRLRGVAPSSGLVSTGCRCQLPMIRSSLGFVPLQGRFVPVRRSISRRPKPVLVDSAHPSRGSPVACAMMPQESVRGRSRGRGYVSGCPAASVPLADLLEVSDVKERSEERSLRSGHRCHPAAVLTPGAGTVPTPSNGGTPISSLVTCATDFPSRAPRRAKSRCPSTFSAG
jgi:hypothetical protein